MNPLILKRPKPRNSLAQAAPERVADVHQGGRRLNRPTATRALRPEPKPIHPPRQAGPRPEPRRRS